MLNEICPIQYVILNVLIYNLFSSQKYPIFATNSFAIFKVMLKLLKMELCLKIVQKQEQTSHRCDINMLKQIWNRGSV